ncbi:hypothetical protein RDI58_024226 [Solanum bulbocastanum]|uniref:Uncharacterized protein n=1 Tax=Solanum bulbocastanum TaxID=147425 RepID=A0AAN8SXT9_SOLBU
MAALSLLKDNTQLLPEVRSSSLARRRCTISSVSTVL